MISLSEIRRLPTKEKFRLIDVIWQEIRLNENEVVIPRMHIDLLDKRSEMVKERKATFLDWDDVKKDIEQLDQRQSRY
jgi:hypothetical protein